MARNNYVKEYDDIGIGYTVARELLFRGVYKEAVNAMLEEAVQLQNKVTKLARLTRTIVEQEDING